jgi:protocatechuate 3,4-dioxygenase beta subunit
VTRYLNRRQALAGLGTVSLGALLAACDDDTNDVATSDGGTATVERETGSSSSKLFDEAPSCVLTPEQTEGPFYFDVDKIRGDIREDTDGTELRLAIRVRDAQECEPIRNAVVDIWHCDALGSYSGFTEQGTFLRGAQVTNAEGIVEFTTVYPGWYMGRTVHIHAKVHIDNTTALTTQLYFDEDVTAAVYEQEPYSSRTGRDTFNDDDGIYDERTQLKLSREDDGYAGAINFDVERA